MMPGRYICEISPARHRGALTTGPQLFVCFGLLGGFFTCYGTTDIETDLSWRLPFVLLAIYATAFSAATFLLLPPSPRWLEDQGRSKSEITAAWDALEIPDTDQNTPEDALPEDAPSASISTAVARKGFNVGGPESKFDAGANLAWQVMGVLAPEVRSRFFTAVFLMAMQQLSGIDGVLYVSTPLPSCPLLAH